MTSSALADDVRRELVPLVEALLRELSQVEPRAAEFFDRIHRHLIGAREEIDLGDAFLDLSTAAFVLEGETLSPAAFALVDALLAKAQELATALSASRETSH